MTLILDQRTRRISTSSVRVMQIMWNKIRFFRLNSRRRRPSGQEHEVLASMSHYHLRDIGLTRGEVTFGIIREKGVFDDADD